MMILSSMTGAWENFHHSYQFFPPKISVGYSSVEGRHHLSQPLTQQLFLGVLLPSQLGVLPQRAVKNLSALSLGQMALRGPSLL